jgi:hypothetical protein
MARNDLLCDVIRYGLENDSANLRRAAEAICAEEHACQHSVLSNKIENLLRQSSQSPTRDGEAFPAGGGEAADFPSSGGRLSRSRRGRSRPSRSRPRGRRHGFRKKPRSYT